MRIRLGRSALFALTTTVAACAAKSSLESGPAPDDAGAPRVDGSSDVDGSAGGDGGTVIDGGPGDYAADGSTSDGGACNTLVNAAPVIPVMREPSALPSALGGILEDGTYHLTEHTLYTGDGGATGPTGTNARISMLVSGAASGVATLQVVSRPNGVVDRHGTFIATTSGTSMSLTTSCGGSGGETLGYTTLDGGFQWIMGSSSMAQTFTKQ